MQTNTEPVVDELGWAPSHLRERILQDAKSVLAERGVRVSADLPISVLYDALRIVSLIWKDGKIIPIEQFYIDPADEGLLFGKGVWESSVTHAGIPWLWDQHLERLLITCSILGISISRDRLPSAETVKRFVRTITPQDVLVRLNVTAGRPGGKGIVWLACQLRPMPLSVIRLQTTVAADIRNQPYLAWKTFQYASRLRSTELAIKQGFDSGLMLDDEGNVLEATHANVFLKLADGWVTPPASCGLFLPGTVRQLVLDQAPIKIVERTVHRSEVANAQEIFVTNSNVGIVPCTQVDNHRFPAGPDTLTSMEWLKSTLPKPV